MRKNRLLTMMFAFGVATAGMAFYGTQQAEAGGFYRRGFGVRHAPVYRRVAPAPFYRGYYVRPRFRSVYVGPRYGYGYGGFGYGYHPGFVGGFGGGFGGGFCY